MKAYKTTRHGLELYCVMIGDTEHTFFSINALRSFVMGLKK